MRRSEPDMVESGQASTARRGFAIWLAVLGMLLIAPHGEAAVPEGPAKLFRDGAFAEAAAAAAAIKQPDALAFAARARIVKASYLDPVATLEDGLAEALALTEAALALDPAHIEANLQRAVALGLLGMNQGPAKAREAGYATEIDRRVTATLATAPENEWAYAIRGAWHLEIVRGAGPVFAELIYGANRRQGLADYERAIRLDPDNMLLRFEAAGALLRQDPPAYAETVLAALDRITETAPRSALDRLIRLRACHLRRILLRDPAAAAAETERPSDRYPDFPKQIPQNLACPLPSSGHSLAAE